MPTIEFWGCSSVDRALRSHRRGRGFESHQLHQIFYKSRGYGGMVDAEDLKSFGHCDRVGSSPTNPTKTIGCVAQLVRALRSHRRGRWFESNLIHHYKKKPPFWRFFILIPLRDNNPMQPISNLDIVCQDCASRSMVASQNIFLRPHHPNILHSGATNMFGLKPCQYRLCILQQHFDFWHHAAPVLLMTKPGMHPQILRLQTP